jgi:hypothetical protein
MDNAANHPIDPIRRVLDADELARIDTTIRAATDTRQLLGSTLTVVYAALCGEPEPATRQIDPDRYAIPTSQWQAIAAAITNRAHAWGTAAEVALELATNLMPDRYDEPTVPAPDFAMPDFRPAEYQLTLTREALDVIAACEAYLGQLHDSYGPASPVYQAALHSWHRNLTSVLSMPTGGAAHISRDGERSLFIRTSSGLAFAMIFHGATRRCTSPSCAALIDDNGRAHPANAAGAVLDHAHTPTYPIDAPRPGTWSLHS